MNHHYMQRARAAHAQAEAATDPRDKAAYLGAARTWERLANPSSSAFSMQPYVKQLAALKRLAAEPIDAPASAPAVNSGEQRRRELENTTRVLVDKHVAVAIDF